MIIKIAFFSDSKDCHTKLKKYFEEILYDIETTYTVRLFSSSSNISKAFLKENFNLIIVDNAIKTNLYIQILKESSSDIPIIVLSNSNKISDKVSAFTNGATDYIVQPFEYIELYFRTKNALKKITPVSDSRAYINEVVFNEQKAAITTPKKGNIYLTSSETAIIYYLYKNTDRFVSTEEILENVLGHKDNIGNPETVRTHIKNIRGKIEEDPSNPQILVSLSKRGYRYIC